MNLIDTFTDAELDAMSRLSIQDIIDGKTSVRPGTPVMVIDAGTDRPAVVTIRQLGEDMVSRSQSEGYLGKPAGAVLAQRGLGLLAAAGITTFRSARKGASR